MGALGSIKIIYSWDYMYCKAVTTYNSIKFFLLLVLLASITVAGCSAPISPALKASTDFLITFAEVEKNPDAYRGTPVLWGGDILRTMQQNDGTTLIEIRQRTLAMNEEPQDIYLPEGRFFVRVNRHLDPSLYHAGKEITVAGEILGKKIMLSGNTRQQYPLYRAINCIYGGTAVAGICRNTFSNTRHLMMIPVLMHHGGGAIIDSCTANGVLLQRF
jgi:outer membrane lipoprotein